MQEFKKIEDYPIIHEWTISDKQLENAELKETFLFKII